METLIVKDRDLIFRIGKIITLTDSRMLNVYTNFNPIRKLPIVDMIGSLEPVKEVSNVSRYDENSGGFAVEIKKGKSEADFQSALTEMLATAIL